MDAERWVARATPTDVANDAAGNLICYNDLAESRGATGWRPIGYDSSHRLTTIADPDDSSVSGCGKTGGLPGSTIVTTKVYQPDGTLTSSQTPSEAAAAVQTTFTDDQDGNVTSETSHHNSVAGTTYKWYDGANRLVKIEMPRDSNDYYRYSGVQYPWLNRYVYDSVSERKQPPILCREPYLKRRPSAALDRLWQPGQDRRIPVRQNEFGTG